MTRAQFFFSLGSGAAVASGGFLLATAGVADWGLFWVGSAIAAVAVVSAVKSSEIAGTGRSRRLLAVPVER